MILAQAHSNKGAVVSPPRLASVAQATPTAYVYRGPGAGAKCSQSTIEALRKSFAQNVQVQWLSPQELRDGKWRDDCVLLVMPGGADLPYCRELNGQGNALIKEYVRNGGSYLGICAGAYYASQQVEFEEGHPILEVMGPRELGFYPGIARGSAYAGFDYASDNGVVAAPITFVNTYRHCHQQQQEQEKQEHKHRADTMPEQQASKKRLKAAGGNAVVVAQQHVSPPRGGDGSTAEEQHESQEQNEDDQSHADAMVRHRPRLQSAHLVQAHVVAGGGDEASSAQNDGWSPCVDYCNGGPVFVASALPSAGDPPTSSIPDVQGAGTIIASDDHDACDDVPGRPRQGYRYTSPCVLPEGVTVLARYLEVGPQALAAVRCEVDTGVAVLVSTHPEIHPEVLEPQVTQQQPVKTLVACGAGGGGGASDEGAVDGVQECTTLSMTQEAARCKAQAMLVTQSQREAFWCMLLAACCASFCLGSVDGQPPMLR